MGYRNVKLKQQFCNSTIDQGRAREKMKTDKINKYLLNKYQPMTLNKVDFQTGQLQKIFFNFSISIRNQ